MFFNDSGNTINDLLATFVIANGTSYANSVTKGNLSVGSTIKKNFIGAIGDLVGHHGAVPSRGDSTNVTG